MGSMKQDVLKVLADVLCFFIFALPLWVYNLLDVVPLTMNGFFCSDTSIRYPYRSSTLSSALLFVTGVLFMLASVLLVEILLYRRQRPISKSYFHPLICNIYRAIGYSVCGACVNQFLTDIGKQCVGRLRPHFFDLCMPNVTCGAGDDPYVYNVDFYCTRTAHPLIPASNFHERMLDSRKSFPSGHASFSFYMAIFVIFYLEYRLTSQHTRLVRHLAQTGMVAWAVWVCCTRIFDFKHRFSDVAAGMLLGSAVAVATFYMYRMSVRKTQPSRTPKDTESNGVDLRSARSHVSPKDESSMTNVNESASASASN